VMGQPAAGVFAAARTPSKRTRFWWARAAAEFRDDRSEGHIRADHAAAPKVLQRERRRVCASPTQGCGDGGTKTIKVSRGPQFPGGPGFKATISNSDTESLGTVPGGNTANRTFQRDIVRPMRADNEGQSPATLVPPARTDRSLSDTAPPEVVLGGPGCR